MNGLDNHYRANSYPITLRPRRHSASHEQSKSHRGSYSKHHQQGHKRQPETGQTASAVSDERGFGLHGKKMTMRATKYAQLNVVCSLLYLDILLYTLLQPCISVKSTSLLKPCTQHLLFETQLLLINLLIPLVIVFYFRDERGNYDLKPEIWHNRVLPKPTGAGITHAGGMFNQPQKYRGQHFTHHPEWPTA